LAAFSLLSGFNGLYGQDAHEYLRLSRTYYEYLLGAPYVPTGFGDSEFAVGYPLAGALLRLLIPDDILALQAVSWLSAGFAFYFFDRLLQRLATGTHLQSRLVYSTIFFAMAPYFVRAGCTLMSDALGLALTLAALLFSIRCLERHRGRDIVWAALFMALAVTTRYSLGALLLPLAIVLLVTMARRRRVKWLVAAGAAGLLGLAPHILLKMNVSRSAFSHSMMQDWSLWNLFKTTFTNANGTVDYGWPNGLYIFFPLAHPGFFLLLGLLFIGLKRTDFLLPVKRLLLICLGAHLLFLGGVPHQNLRFLLPDYTVLLLLLFPAFDRFFAYGFYFLKKRWMYLALGLFVGIQLFANILILRPIFQRNRLERKVAAELRQVLPPDAVLYAFDLDVSLKTYLPGLTMYNLWERRYVDFQAGSFILFNEPRLRPQWQGQNPILNWDFVREHYRLQEIRTLPEGWTLYRMMNDE